MSGVIGECSACFSAEVLPTVSSRQLELLLGFMADPPQPFEAIVVVGNGGQPISDGAIAQVRSLLHSHPRAALLHWPRGRGLVFRMEGWAGLARRAPPALPLQAIIPWLSQAGWAAHDIDFQERPAASAPADGPVALIVARSLVDARSARSALADGVGRARQNDWEGALERFDTARELDPSSADTWAAKAGACIQTHRAEDALRACEAALLIDSNHVGALFNKGLVLMNELRRPREAAEAFEAAVRAGHPQAAGAAATCRNQVRSTPASPNKSAAEVPHLVEHARAGTLVVFAGAGISVAQPTGLPSWGDFAKALVTGVAEVAAELVPSAPEMAAPVREHLRWRSVATDGWQQMPAMYVPDTIVRWTRRLLAPQGSYFSLLASLFRGDYPPNHNHLALARLARAGSLRAVITTNFDSCIEAAFTRERVPFRLCVSESDHQAFADGRWPAGVIPILKIHGTHEAPLTLVDTLGQRMIHFSLPLRRAMEALLQKCHWLFLGYSGLDFDANPNYLLLEASRRGFTWLVRDKKDWIEPLEALAETVRPNAPADHQIGELPEWLESLAGPPTPSTIPSQTPPGRQDWQPTIAPFMRTHWGPGLCALILADMLEHVGRARDAYTLLEEVREKPFARWRVPQASMDEAIYRAMADVAFARRGGRLEERALEYAAGACAKVGDIEGQVDAIAADAVRSLDAGELKRVVKITDRAPSADQADARLLLARASALGLMGRLEPALETCRRGIEVARSQGDARNEAELQNRLGGLLRELGVLEKGAEAEGAFERAILLYRLIGYRKGVGQVETNVGNLYRYRADRLGSTNDYDRAVNSYRRSLRIKEDIRETVNVPIVLHDIACVRLCQRRYAEAAELLEQALELKLAVNRPVSIAETMLALANAYCPLGRREEALQMARQAERIFCQCGAPRKALQSSMVTMIIQSGRCPT